jgi:glutaredoxin-related protein
MSIQDKIRQQLSSDKIVLYEGYTPVPAMRVSAKASQMLGACGASATYDILSDRKCARASRNTPIATFPQLYVNGDWSAAVISRPEL